MTSSEREMVRPLDGSTGEQDQTEPASRSERFTSLQPTYEDSVAPGPEDEWFEEE